MLDRVTLRRATALINEGRDLAEFNPAMQPVNRLSEMAHRLGAGPGAKDILVGFVKERVDERLALLKAALVELGVEPDFSPEPITDHSGVLAQQMASTSPVIGFNASTEA